MENDFTRRIKPYLDQIKPLEPIPTGIQPRFSACTNIKAIIFDIYGTLIMSASGDLDKSVITVENLNEAITSGGFSWTSRDYGQDAEHLLRLFQQTVLEHQKVLKTKGIPYPEIDIVKVWKQCMTQAIGNGWAKKSGPVDYKMLTVVFELLGNQVWPMPDMRETLQKLQNAKVPLGIVSNAQFYTPVILNYFLENVVTEKEHILGFEEQLSIYSYKISRSKPDVFLFNELKKALHNHFQLKPQQVLFVGNDMVKDVWTAHQAGFLTALLAADERSLRFHKEDKRSGEVTPDFVITELKQLFQIIDI